MYIIIITVKWTPEERKRWGGKRSREHIKKERELAGVERDPVNTSKKKGS